MRTEKYLWAEIPKEFYSFETGRPFTHCIECNIDFQRSGIGYLIEKVIRQYQGYRAQDVISEYALCIPCIQEFSKSISPESMKVMDQYFERHADREKRLELVSAGVADYRQWVDACFLSGKKRGALSEYQMTAQCRHDQLILNQLPYVISNEVSEELIPLLSQKTRDEFDKFNERHFGPPPGLEKELPTRRTLLI